MSRHYVGSQTRRLFLRHKPNVIMDYTNEFLENVLYAGKMELSLQEMFDVLQINNRQQFQTDLVTPGNKIYDAYSRGVATAYFEIEKKLIMAAELGDKASIELLWKVQAKREAKRDRITSLIE